ncbi:MAG TPA: hypothetical protein ENH91_05660 [Leeuwenhoekiella sp.]|nr:hypothetical protein [Leeuwenhoekiella sp.]
MTCNLQFYKEFYLLEEDRKQNLNNSVNIPILILTGILSLHFFVFSQDANPNFLVAGKVLAAINFVIVLLCLYYLVKSFSNLASGYVYRELANMVEIRKYEKKLIQEQLNVEKVQLLFEIYIIDEFTICAKHNFEINKYRTENFAKAKRLLFISITLSITLSTLFIISIV